MILDYEYSRDKKQFSISFIRPDGNKEVMHFDNIQKFITYYYTPEGRFNTWNEAKCDTKYTYNPSRFDLKEFIYNLSPEIQEKLDGKTFPKLYAFDIETRLKSGPHGEIGMGDFTDPVIADEPIHTISLVSPNMNGVVMGDKPLSDEQIKWVTNQFHNYLDSIPFYHTLNLPKPKFKYIYFDSEERMLRFFLENVIAKIPVIAGWNSIGYDWCYITSRIKNFYPNISIADGSYTHTTRYNNYTNLKGETIKLPYPVHTLVLDMMDVIDSEDTQVLPIKESMNLDYISHEALGANKVEYDGNLEELYINDFAKYVFYNLIDSILVQLNDKKFKTMDHIYMYSLYAKERIGQCFSKIALTESLILKHFRTTNTKIVYETKEQVERGRLVGAYVKLPVAGLWELVCCNDFAGLYPTTGIVTNISFDNFICTAYDEEKLAPYKHDLKNYIVAGASVYKNKGTLAKPTLGDFVAQYLDEEKLAPYRNDKNYFVSINGHVYKNDKDYTLKQVWNNLRLERKYSKYLSKKLDAHINTDIAHILRCYNETGDITKLHRDILNKYTDEEIDKLKEMGYNFTCGEDLISVPEDELKELARIIKDEIIYLSNLEQAIKLMMNSIYGGTSHQAFYWFNIALANDITGEGRNLTHHMERHLNEFWRDSWQTNPELKKLQDDLGIKLKSPEDIKLILDNSHDNSLVTCVYGDSVDGCSLIHVRLNNIEGVMLIEDLYTICKKQYGVICIDDQGSEHIRCPYEILNYKDGHVCYSKVKDIISHKVNKSKWQLKTKSGKEIYITSDHSLVVFRDNQKTIVKPCEVQHNDNVLTIYSDNYQFEEIISCEQVGEFNNESVYDIEMNDNTHTFIANDILVHNTDSLYLSYKDLISTIEGSEKLTLEEKLKIILKINTEFLDKHNKEHLRDYFISRNVRPDTADLEEFELETVNKRGVWLHETKKRYGQILLWKEGKFYDMDDLPIKVKGLEVIKSSYPTIARKQLKQMLQFILEYDGKYLTQELNLMSQKFLKEFQMADVDMISGNLRVNGYMQKVINDTSPNGFVTTPGAPFNVKALAMYNWLNNVHHLGSEPIYGGKLKYYTVKGSSKKNGDIYFAYEGTKHPKWANKYAPIDPIRMYQKFVLDPINRILSSAALPILHTDGSIQFSLF